MQLCSGLIPLLFEDSRCTKQVLRAYLTLVVQLCSVTMCPSLSRTTRSCHGWPSICEILFKHWSMKKEVLNKAMNTKPMIVRPTIRTWNLTFLRRGFPCHTARVWSSLFPLGPMIHLLVFGEGEFCRCNLHLTPRPIRRDSVSEIFHGPFIVT